MPHGDLQIIAGKGSRECGSRISMDQNNIRFYFFQNFPDIQKNRIGDIKQGLILFHDGKIIIRLHMKDLKNLLQHFTMLSADTDHRTNRTAFSELIDDRAHLDGLWSGSEYQKDCLHFRVSFSRFT